MTDEPRVDLSPVSEAMTLRADRVTARVMARIAQRRSLPFDVSRQLSRFALPALLAAAASVTWLVATRPSPAPPQHLQRLLLTGRPVQLVEIMVAMEEGR